MSRINLEGTSLKKELSRTGGDWMNIVPVIKGSVSDPIFGNSLVRCHYTVVMSTCHLILTVIVGSVFNPGTGSWMLKPPVTPVDFGYRYAVGSGTFHDTSTGTNTYLMSNRLPEVTLPGGLFDFQIEGVGDLTNTSVPWAVNDEICVRFTFPIW